MLGRRRGGVTDRGTRGELGKARGGGGGGGEGYQGRPRDRDGAVSHLGKRGDMVLFPGMEFGARVDDFLICLLLWLDHGCIG